MKKQEKLLPDNYHLAVAEINGRFYPLRTETIRKDEKRFGQDIQLDFPLRCTGRIFSTGLTPYALGEQPTHGVISFRTRREALDFCHRYQETFDLRWQWRQMATKSEIYPERNAWYREEIAQHSTGGPPNISPSVSVVYASVYLHGENPLSSFHCAIWGDDIDNAYVRLYEAVCQHRSCSCKAQ